MNKSFNTQYLKCDTHEANNALQLQVDQEELWSF